MTQFEQRYKKLYRDLYNFHQRHCNAKTESEWEAVAEEFKRFKAPHEIHLALAVYAEIERNMIENETHD